jgi:repressor of nif and glnA expression
MPKSPNGTPTCDELIVKILKRAGHPLHYKKITDLVSKRGYSFRGKTPDATIRASLIRGRQFTRTGRGTWGLS